MESSRDESTGSLIFFSTLQDEKLIPTLQQLMLQIKNFKGDLFYCCNIFSKRTINCTNYHIEVAPDPLVFFDYLGFFKND